MMKKLRFILLVFLTGVCVKTMAQGQEPIPPFYLDENDHYVYYTGMDAGKQFMTELIYTLKETEDIGGHQYYKVYDRISFMGTKQTYTIHMREERGRLLVMLDEYIRFMLESRGRDMTTFYDQCQYEVTEDGEMVLYDFNMQVGDKFQSVEGKPDIFVTKVSKYIKFTSEGQVIRNQIYLSNGAYLLDYVGLISRETSGEEGVFQASGDFFDYLNDGKWDLSMLIAQHGEKCLYGSSGGEYDPEKMGVNSVREDASKTQEVFDLSGRKVINPSSGLYIRDGKKIFVK